MGRAVGRYLQTGMYEGFRESSRNEPEKKGEEDENLRGNRGKQGLHSGTLGLEKQKSPWKDHNGPAGKKRKSHPRKRRTQGKKQTCEGTV